jgi:hypothetical protein
MIEHSRFFNWIKGLQAPARSRQAASGGHEKCRELVAAFFIQALFGSQAFLRMNSPIMGQMISRQRRPEKMP